MKKLLAAILIAVFAITLTACDNEEPTELDCPVGQHDEDGVCVDDEVDPLDCPTGQHEEDGECVLDDNRTPAEIAAALIEDNWDGSMDHVDTMMELMNFDDAMTLITEFSIDVEDGDETVVGSLVIQDEVLSGEYDIVQRTVTGHVVTTDLEGTTEEDFEFVLVIEETNTGFIVYYDTSFLRAMIAEEEVTEVQEVLDTLDANGTWFMFKFDDSLSNLVEMEVLKEMAILALYQEMGDDILTVIEQEIDNVLGVTLVTYGFDFDVFVQHIFDDEFEAAEAMIDGVNFDQLIYDLDQLHLVPEIINHLTMYEADMLLIDPTWDLAAETAFLLANGTEAWLNQLTEEEIEDILTVHDPMLGEAYAAYMDDDLDHWIVMQFLNDPQVQMELAGIPGLDVPGFVATMDMLDYDAFYMETVDMDALFQAVYDGYAAYDAFVGDLNATAPETASILAHFGGMGGLIDTLQQYMVYVDDVQLGFENLEMFEDYVDPQYYLDIALLDIALEVTEDFDILTTGTVQLDATSQLFQDFTEDLYWYLDDFETFDMPYVDVLNCPELAECEIWEEYPEIIEALESLGDIVLTVQYDPFNMDEVLIEVQFADLLQSVADMDDMNEVMVNDLSVTITMLTEAEPEVPETDITDVNQVAEDFARFSLVMEAREYLKNIEDYYMMFPESIPTVPTNIPVMDINNYIGVSVAFDEELSYYRITGNEIDGYEYQLQLFWLDGTPVYTEPLFLSDLEMQFGSGTGAPNRTDFVYWMDKVVLENFNMTKLFLVYMWERETDYYFPGPF